MSHAKKEAVDFYSGHRNTLEYLGSIWVPDGSPEALGALELFTSLEMPDLRDQYVESDFRDQVSRLVKEENSVTSWSHPYRNSIGSDWSYRYEKGSVSVYYRGVQYMTIMCNGARQPYQFFPDMSKINAG